MSQKICANPWCKNPFEITDADLAFYEKVSPVIAGKRYLIPPPTICPECRQQRRLAWRNERRLYHRTCDLTKQDIISAYSPEKPHRVFSPDAWNSDQWDAVEYGREFDFSRPFFDQFRKLQEQVPRIALHVISNENSPYVNLSGYNKNCYLIFAAEYDEDCLYGTQVIKSRHCVDTLNCYESENCYELVDCEKCYNLFFSQNCNGCSDSHFLYDCRECAECFFCINLRNKKHCIFNEQWNKEEYEKRKSELLGRLQTEDITSLRKEFAAFKRQQPHRARVVVNCENVEGNYLQHSRNLHHCFDLSHAEDCTYVYTGFKTKDLMDVCHTTEAELGYEGMSFGYGAYGGIFTHGSWSSRNILYCDIAQSCSNCFGCVCLRQKTYCILNGQYTKEEYERLIPKIIEHMRKTGEWGEFFPSSMSPFCYNETIAQEHFPLTREEVIKRRYTWRDEKDEVPEVEKIIPAQKLPEKIEDIPDDILNWAIQCEKTGRPYRVIKQELSFYRQHGLPVPHLHPDERHKRRLAQRNPRKLWDRECMKCKKPIRTTYGPDRPETVYCEKCYLEAVY